MGTRAEKGGAAGGSPGEATRGGGAAARAGGGVAAVQGAVAGRSAAATMSAAVRRAPLAAAGPPGGPGGGCAGWGCGAAWRTRSRGFVSCHLESTGEGIGVGRGAGGEVGRGQREGASPLLSEPGLGAAGDWDWVWSWRWRAWGALAVSSPLASWRGSGAARGAVAAPPPGECRARLARSRRRAGACGACDGRFARVAWWEEGGQLCQPFAASRARTSAHGPARSAQSDPNRGRSALAEGGPYRGRL